MGEGPEDDATRGSYWQSIANRRKTGIAAALAVAILGVAGTLALSATRPPARDGATETTGTIIPAEETSETTVAVPSYEDTHVAEPAPGAGATVVPPASALGYAPLVSYRRDGWLCVAAEDGTGERRVVASAAGVQTLSPDGGALAFVDAGSGVLAIADVASGALVAVGPALQDPPSWSPDSGWLAYTAPGPKVVRVTRFGTSATDAFAGSMPSVSVRDATIVGVGASGEVAVWRAGAVTSVRPSGTVTGLATDGATIYYGAMAASGAASLRAVGTDGKGDRALLGKPDSTRAVTFGEIIVAPDASQLAYAERSDDGFSRMFAVPAGGGGASSLCVRRDCYPLRWTADSRAVLFIEGNSFQGDPTALMRVTPTGTARRLLVAGADR